MMIYTLGDVEIRHNDIATATSERAPRGTEMRVIVKLKNGTVYRYPKDRVWETILRMAR